MTLVIDLSDVKEGQALYHIQRGICLCPSVSTTRIWVELNGSQQNFDFFGKRLSSDEHPSLFHSEQEMRDYFASLPPVRPDLKLDDPVIVDGEWYHFARWDGDTIVLFHDGCSSLTHEHKGFYLVFNGDWRIPTKEEIAERKARFE